MSTLKDKLIQTLCDDLTESDMMRLVQIIQLKISKGYSASEIGVQLVTATAETISIALPEMEDEEVVELAEAVADALIDRVIEYMGMSPQIDFEEQEEERSVRSEQLN